MDLSGDCGVYTIQMRDGENRVDYDFIDTMHSHLNILEDKEGAMCLVLTGEGKFFSNGLRIDLLASEPREIITAFHKLLLRLITLPFPTIAAINGHCFAGGAMLALAMDYRVMNKSKGYICVNEITLGFNLPPGMHAILRCKTDPSTRVEMMLGGKRFDGKTALARKLVDKLEPPERLLDVAREMAGQIAPLGEHRLAYKTIRQEMFRSEIKILTDEGLGYSEQIFAKM